MDLKPEAPSSHNSSRKNWKLKSASKASFQCYFHFVMWSNATPAPVQLVLTFSGCNLLLFPSLLWLCRHLLTLAAIESALQAFIFTCWRVIMESCNSLTFLLCHSHSNYLFMHHIPWKSVIDSSCDGSSPPLGAMEKTTTWFCVWLTFKNSKNRTAWQRYKTVYYHQKKKNQFLQFKC